MPLHQDWQHGLLRLPRVHLICLWATLKIKGYVKCSLLIYVHVFRSNSFFIQWDCRMCSWISFHDKINISVWYCEVILFSLLQCLSFYLKSCVWNSTGYCSVPYRTKLYCLGDFSFPKQYLISLQLSNSFSQVQIFPTKKCLLLIHKWLMVKIRFFSRN